MKRLLFFLFLLACTLSFAGVLSTKVIVLDPGHGGVDNGARSPNGLLEKTINLQVALDLEKLLSIQGATVYMTRDSDRYVSLEDRIALANEKKADLFVCMHHNSLPGYPNFDETEAYYWSLEGPSKRAAECLGESVARMLNLRLRVKKVEFKVLRLAKVPAVLIELSYLSCISREKWLSNPSNLWKEALALDAGILSYFEENGGGSE